MVLFVPNQDFFGGTNTEMTKKKMTGNIHLYKLLGEKYCADLNSFHAEIKRLIQNLGRIKDEKGKQEVLLLFNPL